MSVVDKKTEGVTTINYVVMSVLNRLRDYSMRHYSFLEQVVIEGYTDLNIWHMDNIEVVYLRMGENKTVDLPCDYIDYIKIGVPMSGKIRVITNDKQMLLPRKFADGEQVDQLQSNKNRNDKGSVYFLDHFRNGQYVAGLYGMRGGIDHTYYRIDRENRQIIFGGNVPRAEIVLEYLSSGVRLQGNTIIPREAVPALRAYALWQLIEYDNKSPLALKERRKREYEEQVTAMRHFQSTFTMDEYKRHVYRHSMQAAKR